MTKEDAIKWLERIIEAEKENPFAAGKLAAYSLDSQLKAASLLADLQGWKVNYCRKAGRSQRPNPSGMPPGELKTLKKGI